jgi:predicted enzyme related to lactoylglutathione lyase
MKPRYDAPVQAAAVLFVKDLDRMRSFYERCFNLDVVDTADDHCILESAIWILSLVVVADRVAAAFEIPVPPIRREAVPIKLGFRVESIGDSRPVVVEMGGLVDPISTEWDFRDSRHCDGVDPEGNVFELLEDIVVSA